MPKTAGQIAEKTVHNPLMGVTISADWTAEEMRLDCTRCDWSHVIQASAPALGAVAQIAVDHVCGTPH